MARSDGGPTTYERGLEVRRDVLGADHVDRSLQNASEFTRPMHELVTE
jgi:4-carboxymuconolactone decarboxylase